MPTRHRSHPFIAALIALTLGLGAWPPAWAQDSPPMRAPNSALWGYTGLLTVPTADVLGDRSYYLGLQYFPAISGLSGNVFINLFENLEAGLVWGLPPASGFSGLAANLKYRILAQDKGSPVSLAVGATLLGLDRQLVKSYVSSNNLYLILGRDFHWPLDTRDWHIASLHAGFMGGVNGARLIGGLEIPVLDYGRFKVEYVGAFANQSQMVHFGVNLTPLPFLNLSFGIMQLPDLTFWDREFVVGVGYKGNFPWETPLSPTPSPTPSPSPTTPPLLPGQGHLKGRVMDEASGVNLSNVKISLNPVDSPDIALTLTTQTDGGGNFEFAQLPPGEYQLILRRDGWKEATRQVSVQDAVVTLVRIPLLMQTGEISGKVTLPAGSPRSPELLQIQLQDLTGNLYAHTAPDAEGKYAFKEIPPGDYTLVVRQGDLTLHNQTLVILPGAVIYQDLNLGAAPSASPAPSPTAQPSAAPTPAATPAPTQGQIEGTVTNAAKQPIASVRLKMENADLMLITLSGADGTYAFRELPPGAYRLTVSKDGYKTRAFQVTVKKGESLTHSVTLESDKK